MSQIGSGGMASIWLAVDGRSGRQVALKRLLPHAAIDPELRRAFHDEARLGLRLRHANVVQTFEARDGATDRCGEDLMVLEFLRGRSLRDVMIAASERKVPVPIDVALTIVRDAARGLHHAHQLLDEAGQPMQLVHRDVSPHNVFVCVDGLAKILDFGIAKARGQVDRTEPGTIKGKVSYLAPELLLGRAADARLDVFSLGVILHEILSGAPLFRTDSEGETLLRILELPVPALESARPDVPASLGAIVQRALKRDPERRMPSADALADTIEAVARAENIPLGPARVREFVIALFPDDSQRHAARAAAANTVVARLASRSVPVLPEPPPRRRTLPRTAVAVGLFSLTAFAAVGVHRHISERGAPTPEPVPIAAPVPAPSAPSVVALPAPEPPAILQAPPTLGARRARGSSRSGDCGVYVTMSKGTSVVCGGRVVEKHKRR